MVKRRLKIKKKAIVLLILIIILLVLLSPLFFVKITLIGQTEIILDYGEKYSEPGFKAYILNKEITDKIKIENNVEENVGSYEVTYIYEIFLYKIKRTRKIIVSDLTGPEIVLNGDNGLNITVDTKYEEPGYVAIDKLAGDLTNDVKVTNNIDISTPGEYEVIYEVKDKAGNLSTKIRKVKVERLNPIHMSIQDYTLDGWYDSTKLGKTQNYGDEYFNKITMVGDSNTKNMYLSGYLKGIKTWAIPCLHAESMHSIDINLYGLGTKMKLLSAVEKYKPEIMILNFGTFSTSWISESVFIKKANSMIEEIKEKSPNTKIILISIYPIRKGDNINKFEQSVINKYNFLILEMADKYGLKYLDVQEALKGDDGYGKDEYFSSDKFHLTSLGHSVVKEYIKSHALEED